MKDVGGAIGVYAGAAVLDRNPGEGAEGGRADHQRTRNGVSPRVFDQGQGGLSEACRIADRQGGLQAPLGFEAGGAQAGLYDFAQGADLLGQIDRLKLEIQVVAFGQADHPQILDDARQALDLTPQTGQGVIVDLEHPVGDALQTSLQNGDRGAQFVGDLGVPGDAFFGVRLKPLRHSVEVFHQLGGFAKGAFADGGASGQVAL